MNKQSLSLSSPNKDFEEAIIVEEDIDNLKDIVDLFNINLQKKNIIRTSKLMALQDQLISTIGDRIEHPELFNNQDLITYYKVIQDSISKADNNLDKVNIPSICFTQNQFNINVDNKDVLNRESRRKVLDAINMILNKKSQEDDIIEGEDINDAKELENDESREISTTIEREF